MSNVRDYDHPDLLAFLASLPPDPDGSLQQEAYQRLDAHRTRFRSREPEIRQRLLGIIRVRRWTCRGRVIENSAENGMIWQLPTN